MNAVGICLAWKKGWSGHLWVIGSLTGLFPSPESQIFQPDWFSKRQHPGKREEEEADEGVEGEEEEGGAVGLRKRQHPGRRDDVAAWAVDAGQQKRQHPGRRASWLGYAVTKRQHPGRRLVDPRPQRSCLKGMAWLPRSLLWEAMGV